MERRSSVIIISPCTVPIEANPKAGIEAIVNLLADTLMSLRYKVCVVAAKGSSAPYELIPASRDTMYIEAKKALEAYPHSIICDHSGNNPNDLIDYDKFFRIFHIQPQYVFPGNPSPKSGFVSKYLRNVYGLDNKAFKSCPLIYNGIAVDNIRLESRSPDNNVNGGPVVYIGRICISKGIGIAAYACSMADVPFHIYGGLGTEEPNDLIYNNLEYLSGVIKTFKNCSYQGPIDSPEKKIGVLLSARCVVIPSIEPESCSLLALESAALGIPIAGFDLGGIKEYLGNRVFFASFAGNLEDAAKNLACSILEAIEIRDRKPYLSGDYTARSMTQRYINWWLSQH